MLWIGLALLALGTGMLVWLVVLQRLPVGIAYPMLSLNFVWVTLAAKVFWHEKVAMNHWLGVGFIIVGIVLLGGSL
jgi:undecaprenyl phosphate-alpha-L-ara4N flippase subunit ArnE